MLRAARSVVCCARIESAREGGAFGCGHARILAQLPVGKTILVYANDQPSPAPEPPAEAHNEPAAPPVHAQADLLDFDAPPPISQPPPPQLSSPPPPSFSAPDRPLPTPPARALPEPPARALPAPPQAPQQSAPAAAAFDPLPSAPVAAAAFDPFASAFTSSSHSGFNAPAAAAPPPQPAVAAAPQPAAVAAAAAPQPAATFGSGLMDKFNATKDHAMSKAAEGMDKARQLAGSGTAAPAQVACPGGVADATANLVHTMGHHPSAVEAVQTNVPPPPYESPPSYADGDERNRKNAVTDKQNEQFKKVLECVHRWWVAA